MKFQLVLQFAAAEMTEFDELAALEEKLAKNLPSTTVVDGHDFGSGEFNIFILTDEPKHDFDAARKLLETSFEGKFRAGYRERNTDGYIVLWPEHLHEFRVA
jgi:hypothetical protein